MRVPAATMRRFWTMLAHYAGAIWNASEIGRSLGGAHTTVRRYLDLLASALVVRTLQPWHENLGKRQVKAPKVYVRDTGLLHALLGVPDIDALESHPKLGASWESFAIEQVLLRAGAREAYYWRTQAGSELDLLLFLGGKRIGGCSWSTREVRAFRSAGKSRRCRCRIARGNWRRWAEGGKSSVRLWRVCPL